MIPTPSYGEVGSQWWYYTHAFLSLQWRSEEEEIAVEDLPTVIQGGLVSVFGDVMFPSMIADMETVVSLGNTARLMTAATVDGEDYFDDDEAELNWDDFTLVSSLLSTFSFSPHKSPHLYRRYGQSPTEVQSK